MFDMYPDEGDGEVFETLAPASTLRLLTVLECSRTIVASHFNLINATYHFGCDPKWTSLDIFPNKGWVRGWGMHLGVHRSTSSYHTPRDLPPTPPPL
jgi:hypothetical protein